MVWVSSTLFLSGPTNEFEEAFSGGVSMFFSSGTSYEHDSVISTCVDSVNSILNATKVLLAEEGVGEILTKIDN